MGSLHLETILDHGPGLQGADLHFRYNHTLSVDVGGGGLPGWESGVQSPCTLECWDRLQAAPCGTFILPTFLRYSWQGHGASLATASSMLPQLTDSFP